MSLRGWIGSIVLLIVVAGAAAGLASWKAGAVQGANLDAAAQAEPVEFVTVAEAREVAHRDATTSIGTVLALQSITVRNELAGSVRDVMLEPGAIVEEGDVLVALDVSVEEAELEAQRAQAALAETLLERLVSLSLDRAVPELDVHRARAERDVALSEIARIEAIIARKTIRAPFRGRVGLSDVHPGQYLNEGAVLTTLQGVADAVHVDFEIPQEVAASLREGSRVEVYAGDDSPAIPARVEAVDARVDPTTRNALVRARIASTRAPLPGASVRVRTPVGPERMAVAVPVSALRKGPAGDHVFVIGPGEDGQPRAHMRTVEAGAVLGDDVLIRSGLSTGERVAAAGSFKLRDAALVAIVDPAQASAPETTGD